MPSDAEGCDTMNCALGSLLCYVVLAVLAYLVEYFHRCGPCCSPKTGGNQLNYANHRPSTSSGNTFGHEAAADSSHDESSEWESPPNQCFNPSMVNVSFHNTVTVVVYPPIDTFPGGSAEGQAYGWWRFHEGLEIGWHEFEAWLARHKNQDREDG